jgi:hypothetical protein
MTGGGLFGGRRVRIGVDVDIEKTAESFHAYAVPDGIEIRPGDIVTVHGVPTDIGFGERLVTRCEATVERAGPLRRAWTGIASMALLTELYEVGFEPKEA